MTRSKTPGKNSLIKHAGHQDLAGYDPSKPLARPEREAYCHAIIACGGNKTKAFEQVYNECRKLPRSKANYPYAYFKGAQIRARYDYLLAEYLNNVGIDAESLLVKSAKMIEVAVASQDIQGFKTMVDTIMKIKGEDVKKVMTVSKQMKVTEDDKAAIDALFEEL